MQERKNGGRDKSSGRENQRPRTSGGRKRCHLFHRLLPTFNEMINKPHSHPSQHNNPDSSAKSLIKLLVPRNLLPARVLFLFLNDSRSNPSPSNRTHSSARRPSWCRWRRRRCGKGKWEFRCTCGGGGGGGDGFEDGRLG